MDIETYACMLYLVEAEESGHTPYFLKRCVYAVAKKNGGGRDALNKAFAVCVAQAQKSGKLEKGSMEPTKAGAQDSKAKTGETSQYGFSVDAYEKVLARARKKQKSEGVTLSKVYLQLCEDLQLEQHVDMAKFSSAVKDAVSAAGSLQRSLKERSVAAAPGHMAKLVNLTMGSKGVMGALGLTGLLGAVGAAKGSELGAHFEVMLAKFRGAKTGEAMEWDRAAAKAAQLGRELSTLHAAKKDGEPDLESIVSSLSDVYLLLGQLSKLLVDGLEDPGAKKAAEVVRYDMRGLGQSFMTLSMAHPG